MAHSTETKIVRLAAAKRLVLELSEGVPAARRDDLDQEKFDFAAWLREYRRWTERGCCGFARRGEIEWGGEERN